MKYIFKFFMYDSRGKLIELIEKEIFDRGKEEEIKITVKKMKADYEWKECCCFSGKIEVWYNNGIKDIKEYDL